MIILGIVYVVKYWIHNPKKQVQFLLPPQTQYEVYGLMVKRAAHNGRDVGSNPTRLIIIFS